LAAWLQSAQGFQLAGDVKADQARIMADYQLSGFEPRLKRALGG
jgi:hypothetical protein